MIVAMIFRNRSIEIAVGGKKSDYKYKKRISMEIQEELIKNGEIVDPHALGLQILAELKKNRIRATEVIFAIRSNDIVIADMMVPCVPEKIVMQSAKVTLEKEYPGVSEKNYIAYKTYDIQDDKFYMTTAIAPKTVVETYYALANVLKCKINKITIYADCMAKVFNLIQQENHSGYHFVLDIGNDFIQFYQFCHGVIQVSNSFFTQNYLLADEEIREEIIRQELIDKMYQSIAAITSLVSEETLKYIYINNTGYLTSAEMRFLSDLLNSESKTEVISFRECYEDFDGILLKTMFTKNKKMKKELNFALELDLDDGRNYTGFEAVLSVLAGISVAGFAATMISSGFYYYSNRVMQQTIYQNEVFIRENDSVNQLYLDNVNQKEESEYLQRLNLYLQAADYDFGEFQNRLEDIMVQGASELSRVSLSSTFSMVLEASTANYTNIATVISKLKEEGLPAVELQSVSINRNDEGKFIDVSYVLNIDFRIYSDSEKL